VYCSGAPLRVTKNCYDALKQLRYESCPRTLWVDTICINQSDNDEKSHQVAMMLDIYRNADRVYIWLGESTVDSDYILEWSLNVRRKVIALLNMFVEPPPLL
jgi:hypothetical protein